MVDREEVLNVGIQNNNSLVHIDYIYEFKNEVVTDIKFKNLILLNNYYAGSKQNLINYLSMDNSNTRKMVLLSNGINPYIFRTLFDYDRFSEAVFVANVVLNFSSLNNLNLLDYGCLVSDYGVLLGKLNCNIYLADINEEHLEFAKYRLAYDRINVIETYNMENHSYNDILKNKDIVIFSEILEHLIDPLNMIECCVENDVKYIFTTKYPYGDDNYFNLSGHRKEAQEQSDDVLELLYLNYTPYLNKKHEIMWVSQQFNKT